MALRSRPALVVSTELPPAPAAVEHAPAKVSRATSPGRAGKSQVAFFVDPVTKRQVETLQFQQRRKLQDLMGEALDLLFQKYGMTRTGG